MHAKGVAITILSDNRAAYGLAAEHGLSFWIETPGHKLLFDTGCGETMLRNAETLGIDIGAADGVVLSHGHYDHTGNVGPALERARRARLFLHPDALLPRFSIHEAPKPIGMPETSRSAVNALPHDRRFEVTAPRALAECAGLTGPVPRTTAFEDTGGPFFLDAEGRVPDRLMDDLSLWVRTGAGLVVCLGCCHAGLINTLRHVREVSGEPRVLAIVGGMHLLHADETRLAQTVRALEEYDVSCLYPCHCTGDAAVACLQRRFGSSVQPGFAGMKVCF